MIVNMVNTFLLVQCQHSIMECLGVQVTRNARLVKVCNRLRYDGLVEGRIAKMWLEIVRLKLKESGRQISPQRWERTFMTKLFNITHTE